MNVPTISTFDDVIGEDKANIGSLWDKWLKRFENYIAAIDIDDDSRKRKMLLHFVGSNTFDDFQTIADTGTEYKTAVEKLTLHFKPKVTKQFERALFRRMKQEKGEKIDTYHTRLKQQAGSCGFTDVNDEIYYHIVQTTNDSKLRKKGLRTEMTLEHVLAEGRNNELCMIQNTEMEKELSVELPKAVNKMRVSHPPKQKNQCRNCGGAYPHAKGKESCPAFGRTCHSCKKDHHFAKYCRSSDQKSSQGQNKRGWQGRGCRNYQGRRTVHEVYLFSITLDMVESDVCNSVNTKQNVKNQNSVNMIKITKPPKFKVTINNCEVVVTADSAATCSVLDEDTYKKCLKGHVDLKKSHDKINPYGGGSLRLMGKFTGTIKCAGKITKDIFYVVPGKCGSLLSVCASQQLGLIKIASHVLHKVDGVYQSNSKVANKIVNEYPELHTGIGKMKNYEAKLYIDEEIPPVAQKECRTPFHLRALVEKKLIKLEEEDMIEKVGDDGPIERSESFFKIRPPRGVPPNCSCARITVYHNFFYSHRVETVQTAVFRNM